MNESPWWRLEKFKFFLYFGQYYTRDDWDGEGCKGLTFNSIVTAYWVVDLLEREGVLLDGDNILQVPNGTIDLVFNDDSSFIVLNIREDGYTCSEINLVNNTHHIVHDLFLDESLEKLDPKIVDKILATQAHDKFLL